MDSEVGTYNEPVSPSSNAETEVELTEQIEEPADEMQTAADEILEELKQCREELKKLLTQQQNSESTQELVSQITSLRSEIRTLKEELARAEQSRQSPPLISQPEPEPQVQMTEVVIAPQQVAEEENQAPKTEPPKPKRRKI